MNFRALLAFFTTLLYCCCACTTPHRLPEMDFHHGSAACRRISFTPETGIQFANAYRMEVKTSHGNSLRGHSTDVTEFAEAEEADDDRVLASNGTDGEAGSDTDTPTASPTTYTNPEPENDQKPKSFMLRTALKLTLEQDVDEDQVEAFDPSSLQPAVAAYLRLARPRQVTIREATIYGYYHKNPDSESSKLPTTRDNGDAVIWMTIEVVGYVLGSPPPDTSSESAASLQYEDDAELNRITKLLQDLEGVPLRDTAFLATQVLPIIQVPFDDENDRTALALHSEDGDCIQGSAFSNDASITEIALYTVSGVSGLLLIMLVVALVICTRRGKLLRKYYHKEATTIDTANKPFEGQSLDETQDQNPTTDNKKTSSIPAAQVPNESYVTVDLNQQRADAQSNRRASSESTTASSNSSNQNTSTDTSQGQGQGQGRGQNPQQEKNEDNNSASNQPKNNIENGAVKLADFPISEEELFDMCATVLGKNVIGKNKSGTDDDASNTQEFSKQQLEADLAEWRRRRALWAKKKKAKKQGKSQHQSKRDRGSSYVEDTNSSSRKIQQSANSNDGDAATGNGNGNRGNIRSSLRKSQSVQSSDSQKSSLGNTDGKSVVFSQSQDKPSSSSTFSSTSTSTSASASASADMSAKNRSSSPLKAKQSRTATSTSMSTTMAKTTKRDSSSSSSSFYSSTSPSQKRTRTQESSAHSHSHSHSPSKSKLRGTSQDDQVVSLTIPADITEPMQVASTHAPPDSKSDAPSRTKTRTAGTYRQQAANDQKVTRERNPGPTQYQDSNPLASELEQVRHLHATKKQAEVIESRKLADEQCADGQQRSESPGKRPVLSPEKKRKQELQLREANPSQYQQQQQERPRSVRSQTADLAFLAANISRSRNSPSAPAPAPAGKPSSNGILERYTSNAVEGRGTQPPQSQYTTQAGDEEGRGVDERSSTEIKHASASRARIPSSSRRLPNASRNFREVTVVEMLEDDDDEAQNIL